MAELSVVRTARTAPLKFGREVRMPAMQAGLATRRLTFREVFVCQPPSLISRYQRDHVRRAEPVWPNAPKQEELLAA